MDTSSKPFYNPKLEQLFGSKTRTQLLALFLSNEDKPFFIREITRILDSQINSVRRELLNLMEVGIIRETMAEEGSETEKNAGLPDKKYFRLNQSFVLLEEFKNLFCNSRLLLEQEFIQKIVSCGKIDLFLLTGRFVKRDLSIDMLVVGTVNKSEFISIIKKFQDYLGFEINYSILPSADYLYRRSLSDRFLETLLSGKKIVIVDEFQKKGL